MDTREHLEPKHTIHYLQSLEWLNLRSEGLGVEGVNAELNKEPLVKVVGHISFEKVKRLSRNRRVLEIFFGPYFDLSTSNPDLEAEILNRLISLAEIKSCKVIRLMAYENEAERYFSLGRIQDALNSNCVPYKFKELETSMYDLELHHFGELISASKSSRKNLRHAAQIVIVEAKSEEQIRMYFQELSRMKGRKSLNKRELDANARFSSHRYLFLAQESLTGRYVGTLGFIHDNYLAMEIASSTEKGPEMRGVQEKLHLRAFDVAKKIGLKKFDLAGLERNNTGEWNSIANFKLKFGGAVVREGLIEIDLG
jgi:lipid II:glycine glycyltransferase (peptidoglycan interpeptide bridge formation enzyme)